MRVPSREIIDDFMNKDRISQMRDEYLANKGLVWSGDSLLFNSREIGTVEADSYEEESAVAFIAFLCGEVSPSGRSRFAFSSKFTAKAALENDAVAWLDGAKFGLMTWQPVETSPANTYVLTCRVGVETRHFSGLICDYAEPPETACRDEVLGWILPQRPHDEWRPTHWMPLSLAPAVPL